MSRVCPICGKSFEPSYHRRKYCSHECLIAARRLPSSSYFVDEIKAKATEPEKSETLVSHDGIIDVWSRGI
ncbi:MAG: hypothetical protein IJT82_03460 [Schwartzia sp.]|nr:hypothetical protein [Schwartzia sp. (in: firmicutes)]